MVELLYRGGAKHFLISLASQRLCGLNFNRIRNYKTSLRFSSYFSSSGFGLR